MRVRRSHRVTVVTNEIGKAWQVYLRLNSRDRPVFDYDDH